MGTIIEIDILEKSIIKKLALLRQTASMNEIELLHAIILEDLETYRQKQYDRILFECNKKLEIYL